MPCGSLRERGLDLRAHACASFFATAAGVEWEVNVRTGDARPVEFGKSRVLVGSVFVTDSV